MPQLVLSAPRPHPAQVTSSRGGVVSTLAVAKRLLFLGLPMSLHSFPFNRIRSALCCARRWEGRPSTPPFQWGAAGEVLPPHDQWLRDFDGSAWGLDKLVEPALLQQNPNILERDLQETRDVLLQWAGALQAIFTIYQLQAGGMHKGYSLVSSQISSVISRTFKILVFSLMIRISHRKTQALSFCWLLEMHLRTSLLCWELLWAVTGKTHITTVNQQTNGWMHE